MMYIRAGIAALALALLGAPPALSEPPRREGAASAGRPAQPWRPQSLERRPERHPPARNRAAAQQREARSVPTAPRLAWRQGKRAAFVAWQGAEFYPYAYSDLFEYAFWPHAYDEAYWTGAYGAVLDGVFRADGNATGDTVPCRDPGSGVTAWPFAQIEQAVRPDDAQKTLLDDLRQAAQGAEDVLAAACDAEAAPGPATSLAAMTRRLTAALRAIRTVQPALEAFYKSLNDAQKARFIAIGPDEFGASAKIADCKDVNPAGLPIEDIRDALHPNATQDEKLDRLSLAVSSAAELLHAACPVSVPPTPSERLTAMQTRLDAMAQAAATIQPVLEDFYASLDSGQKARLQVLGRQAQHAN
jgi:hypothetical protein